MVQGLKRFPRCSSNCNTFGDFRGLAITSSTYRSKKLFECAGWITRAVSAPLPVPATAMTYPSTGILPASTAMTVISMQTFVASPKILNVSAISSKGPMVPRFHLMAHWTPDNAWEAVMILVPLSRMNFSFCGVIS